MRNSPFINGRSLKVTRIAKCHECGSINVAKADSPNSNACIHIYGTWLSCNDCTGSCMWEERDTVRRDSLDERQEANLGLIQKSYDMYHNRKEAPMMGLIALEEDWTRFVGEIDREAAEAKIPEVPVREPTVF